MDEQKKPRAWVYARIPGDYDGTMNSFKVCSMQALRDGCDIVGGSTDEHGGWLLRPGYREMMQQVKVGNVDCIYICRMFRFTNSPTRMPVEYSRSIIAKSRAQAQWSRSCSMASSEIVSLTCCFVLILWIRRIGLLRI